VAQRNGDAPAGLKKEALERLARALDVKKNRDAGRLGDVQSELKALDQERCDLEARLAHAHIDLDPASLTDSLALEKWRNATKARLVGLGEQRIELEKIVVERRRVLARSNGEVEALRRLLGSTRRRT
jgi:hypothetical protein